MNPLAALVACFALGAVFLGTAVLLVFNPRSRGVRWYALFQCGLMTWLALQGWAYATGGWERVRIPFLVTVGLLLPGLFLAFALVEALQRPARDALLVVGVGMLLAPLVLARRESLFTEAPVWVWNIGAWVAGTALMVRHGYGEGRRRPGQRRFGRIVLLGMAVVLPLGLLGGIVTRGASGVYMLPLLMVWIQLLTFVGVARLRFYDIDVRVARTGELAAAAAEQERLAVFVELSASLAHEIRNPLTGVRSLAQRLADEEVDEERRRRYAGVILEETQRVERLVAHLLGIARRHPRPTSGEASTPMDPLFEDLLLLVGSRAEKAGVRLVVEGGGVCASAPRETVAQVLLNLLLNAIHHSPAGGVVSLLARTEDEGVELLVRDQGAGVPPGERERIWEPFHTGGDGTGLGLAVVRRIARESGWRVEVGDAPDRGAEFRVRIPAARVDASAPAHSHLVPTNP